MTDNTELKRAASEAKNWGGEVGEGRWYTAECFKRPYFSIPDAEFIAACEPGAVLALIAESDNVTGQRDRYRALLYAAGYQRLDELLGEPLQVAARVGRETKRLTVNIQRDLDAIGERSKSIIAERDRLRAEVAGLKTGYEAYERVNAELKAENEALRKDADRFRRMRAMTLAQIEDTQDEFDTEFDLQLDAAMGKGEQS